MAALRWDYREILSPCNSDGDCSTFRVQGSGFGSRFGFRVPGFLTISFYRDGKWFHLARYFDRDRRLRGPDALALFLGVRVEDVFPLFYDVRDYIQGEPDALAGLISKEPDERFTKEQLIAMAVPDPPE